MQQIKLIIDGPEPTKKITINSDGASIGRDDNCDITLNHARVSRYHARIYCDPFGRWIVEDSGSRNGILIDGKKVKVQAISPGQEICISNYTMSLQDDNQANPLMQSSVSDVIPLIDDDLAEDITAYRPDHATILPPDMVQHLNEFTEHLLNLSSPSDLYDHACSALASKLNTLVAIVRLPCAPIPLDEKLDIVSCHFGAKMLGSNAAQKFNLHFSKRVLETVRSTTEPIKVTSKPSGGGGDIMLTIVDEEKPHVVYAAHVNDQSKAIDVLYIDILEDKAPAELFDFVEAVARQINFVQKNLFFNELQKQEKAAREANVQLKEKDRIKDEYVARVTHDIKGHLAAIRSCLHITADSNVGDLNEKQSNFLGRAQKRTNQLNEFVVELLNLTQKRLSGNLEKTIFSLPDNIAKAISTVERTAKDKSITLTSNVDPSISDFTGDEFSINEMIANLLFNAIKYTPNDKTVHLEASLNNGIIQLDFIDTGIGIPEDEVDKIFEEFFRASNARKNEKDGSGLGLSIVQQIIAQHDGKISAKSVLGEGTTFTVTLPL